MLTYSDLIKIPTFEGRLEYLRTIKLPSEITFAELRYLNQQFYNSRTWKLARRYVISRDLGYDLGIPGRDIIGKAIVHHMNPITPEDIIVHQDEIVALWIAHSKICGNRARPRRHKVMVIL
jgi:hypothetical protein